MENDCPVMERCLSPAGELVLVSSEEKLCMCDWACNPRHQASLRKIEKELGARIASGGSEVIERAKREIDEYFRGERKGFTIPLRMIGTDFQLRVWDELQTIPYGVTASYGDIAKRISNPRAVRAVATAIASNPVSILVPCHRVVGSDGTLTGYAGGLCAKSLLLSLESPPFR